MCSNTYLWITVCVQSIRHATKVMVLVYWTLKVRFFSNSSDLMLQLLVFSSGKDTKGCFTVLSASYCSSVIAKCSIILDICRPESSGGIVVCLAHVEQFSDTLISSLPQITQFNKSRANDLLLCKQREESKTNTIPSPLIWSIDNWISCIVHLGWWNVFQHCFAFALPQGTRFHLAPRTPPFL